MAIAILRGKLFAEIPHIRVNGSDDTSANADDVTSAANAAAATTSNFFISQFSFRFRKESANF